VAQRYIWIRRNAAGHPEFQDEGGAKLTRLTVTSRDEIGFRSNIQNCWIRVGLTGQDPNDETTDDTPLRRWKDGKKKNSRSAGEIFEIPPRPLKTGQLDTFNFHGEMSSGEDVMDPDIEIDDGSPGTPPRSGIAVAAGIGFLAGAIAGVFASRRKPPE
jgi:hypothetical protein